MCSRHKIFTNDTEYLYYIGYLGQIRIPHNSLDNVTRRLHGRLLTRTLLRRRLLLLLPHLADLLLGVRVPDLALVEVDAVLTEPAPPLAVEPADFSRFRNVVGMVD